MLIAMEANTGSEHDIKENNDRSSHVIFKEMIDYISKDTAQIDISKIISLPEVEKMNLKKKIQTRYAVDDWQISKFLHLTNKSVNT